jgi:hypothetical protein
MTIGGHLGRIWCLSWLPYTDTSEDEDANGWRCHDSDFADHKDTMAPLYIRGRGVPGKTSNLAPVYHILLHIYREKISAKVGNFDEVHGFIVNPYAPFVMKLICDTWLKTFKGNLGATEHLNLTFHEEKKIHIMAHHPPKDANDGAPQGNLDDEDLTVTEPSCPSLSEGHYETTRFAGFQGLRR